MGYDTPCQHFGSFVHPVAELDNLARADKIAFVFFGSSNNGWAESRTALLRLRLRGESNEGVAAFLLPHFLKGPSGSSQDLHD